MLLHEIVLDVSFFELLAKYDEGLAIERRARGCAHCGGTLHVSRYARKPRGAVVELGPEYEWRWSFCCSREGCRKRCTPVSVRYFGRRVYLGSVLVLVSALLNGLSPRRVARLHGELGVGLRTLRRWRKWWREEFCRTTFWRGARGRFGAGLEDTSLPGALLERFPGAGEERLRGALSFLSALTSRTG